MTGPSASRPGPRICYVGDNRDRGNLGCRATSMALAALLGELGEVVSTVSGLDITGALSSNGLVTRHEDLRRRVWNLGLRLPAAVAIPARIAEMTDLLLLGPDEAAARIAADPTATVGGQELVDALDRADVVVINGEGDMILRRRRRKLSYLLMLMALCRLRGQPYAYVNSMVSEDGLAAPDPAVIERVRRALDGAAVFTVRDEQSLQLCASLGFRLPIVVPDALFSWKIPDLASLDGASLGALAESFPHEFQGAWNLDEPYVCVSGSSRYDSVRPAPVAAFAEVGRHLIDNGLRPVFVECDPSDAYLAPVAASLGRPFVRWNAHILVHAAVLARSSAYVTGRYHPTILAMRGGSIPVVFGSNSHKLGSLMTLMGLGASELSSDLGPGDVAHIRKAVSADTVPDVERRAAIAATAIDRGAQARSVLAHLAEGFGLAGDPLPHP